MLSSLMKTKIMSLIVALEQVSLKRESLIEYESEGRRQSPCCRGGRERERGIEEKGRESGRERGRKKMVIENEAVQF